MLLVGSALVGCSTPQSSTVAAAPADSAAANPSAARRVDPSAATGTEHISEAEALTLDFAAFDQTPGSGWRVLADQDRWGEAARLIDRYIAAHPQLSPTERMILSLHAGQMYGFAGEDTAARHRFMDALIPNESPNAPIRWNAYMLATIAFLEKDRATLLQSRDVILGGPTVEGCKANLNIVNSFITNFDKPYREAYQAAGPPTLK